MDLVQQEDKICEVNSCNNSLNTKLEKEIGWCEDCLEAQEERDKDWY